MVVKFIQLRNHLRSPVQVHFHHPLNFLLSGLQQAPTLTPSLSNHSAAVSL